MHPLRTVSLALAILVSASLSSFAQTTFTANLTANQETTAPLFTLTNGQPRPVSFGSATFVLNASMTQLTMTVTVFNIDFTGSQTTDVNDNLVNAHIHANATVTVGFNAPVVWGFFGTPFNDNNPNNQTVTPFASGVGGTITSIWDAPEGQGTTLTAQLNNILTGHSYINFHTTQNTGGEIRGALTVVPEPSTTALLGAAFVAAGAAAWRRRRRAA